MIEIGKGIGGDPQKDGKPFSKVGFRGVKKPPEAPGTLGSISQGVKGILEKGVEALLNKIPGVTVVPREELRPSSKNDPVKRKGLFIQTLATRNADLESRSPDYNPPPPLKKE